MNTFTTREDWLTQGVTELRPFFEIAGHTLPDAIRVACGFPYAAPRSRAIGQCWNLAASGDNTHEILISPELAEPGRVFDVLIHELCHTVPGTKGHGATFQRVAMSMLLSACGVGKTPWGSTEQGPGFMEQYGEIIASLGAYPHAVLTPNQFKKTQTTRMLKASCPDCGYTVRLSAKWAAQGLPICPTHNIEMTSEE